MQGWPVGVAGPVAVAGRWVVAEPGRVRRRLGVGDVLDLVRPSPALSAGDAGCCPDAARAKHPTGPKCNLKLNIWSKMHVFARSQASEPLNS